MRLRALAVALAAFAASAAFAADKTVTFNVPVKIENLDPQVSALTMICAITGPNSYAQTKVVSMPYSNGGYVGMVNVPVTVPSADLGKVKSWSCYLRIAGPGAYSGVAPNHPSYPWAKVAPGAVGEVSGQF